jgi:metacaspase-1
MNHRIVWVHGIGNHRPGYSARWQAVCNPFLNLTPASYIEVIWEPILDRQQFAGTLSDDGQANPSELTPQEEAAEEQLKLELAMLIQARDSALREGEAAAAQASDTAGEPGVLGEEGSAIVEWSDVYESAPGVLGPSSWLRFADEYIGDFTRYLVSRSTRTAVKAELKNALRALEGPGPLTIVSHSWGTIVAYESLLDLEVELPSLRVQRLFTLGSPLWMVSWLLQERSGRKPRQTARWINVTARGDRIGSWLRPRFQVDGDYLVPAVGEDAHNSYFVEGNLAVQKDILAATILATDG